MRSGAPSPEKERPPLASVIVANYNGAAFLEQAIGSALKSTLCAIEVIVADDCSSDESAAIVRRLRETDDRVTWLPAERNGGPAAARNRAIRAARGEWLAVLDNDDLLHPQRLERLIAFAEASGADLVADDLLVFHDDDAEPPARFLERPEIRGPFEVTAELYLRQTVLYGRKPNLGFLKPVMKRRALAANGIRYDESLRIAEDDDLVLQCLAAGLRYAVDPRIGYFYRKHGSSITQRFGKGERSAIIEAAARVEARMAAADVPRAALGRRKRALVAADRYHRFADAATPGKALQALPALLGSPGALWLLRHPIYARLKRLRSALAPRRRFHRDGRRHVLIVSRQRIVGNTNGSSVYLLDIAGALREAGMVPHLLQPTPRILGRLPFIRLRPEIAVFESHLIRGVMRLGPWVVSLSPALWSTAAATAAKRVLHKLGPARGGSDRPFPHTISLPWLEEDLLFVARHGRARADAAICDYIFQTEALPFLLRPDSPSAVLVHDLYTLRARSFAAGQASDSVAEQGMAEEAARLASADAAIAIQEEEAGWIARNVPSTQAILAPMAADPVGGPQPGDSRTLLFVGSNAPPNVKALEWFLGDAWRTVRTLRPDAELLVAGRVGDAFPSAPEGVKFLGLVHDLEPLYERAGVVISPLTVGSGLKIKLIEALARGKAIVATPTTVQGVQEQTKGALCVTGDPSRFAEHVAALLENPRRREELGQRALAAARRHFAPAACYAGIVSWANGPARRGNPAAFRPDQPVAAAFEDRSELCST